MLFDPRRFNTPPAYTFPPISFLKLQDYITNLVNTYGGVYWPLDDVANNSYNRVINTAVAKGRNLVVDPTMDVTAAWSKGTGWTVTGGVAHCDGSNVAISNLQTNPSILLTGKVYEVTYTLLNRTAGTVVAQAGGSGAQGTVQSSNGTYTQTLGPSTGPNFILVASIGFVGDIDNVSVKELNIPAYDATPTQLLNTDVWNGLGVGAWTAFNNVTLSAQTTTRHDGVSGTVLRVTRGSSASPYGAQTILDTTKVQRVYGWARGDATAIPIVRQGSTILFTGTASTDWQPFDVVFVPTATDLRLEASTSVSTKFVEFDVTVVALDAGIRQDNPVVNGTFSADASWTKNTGATISGGTANFSAVANLQGITQNCLCIGKKYKVTFDVTSYTSGAARATTGNVGQSCAAVGTYTDILIATQTAFQIQAVGTSTFSVDNITITELSPLVGLPVNGAVLGNSEAPLRIGTSVGFDGVNDTVNLSSAQFNSVFNPAAGTFSLFMKPVSSAWWTDGVAHFLCRLFLDSSNEMRIRKTSANNALAFTMITGGVTIDNTITSQSFTSWTLLTITWDSAVGEVKAYLNGVQVGSTMTGFTTLAGNLSSTFTCLAGSASSGTLPFSGNESNVFLSNVAFTVSQISEISKLGDAS